MLRGRKGASYTFGCEKESIMEVSAAYLGGTKFEVDARGHRVISDQPVDNGGDDAGMSPPEFLLASLATCAGYYAAQYLNARGLATDDLTVRVTAQKAAQPARLASFGIDVTAPGVDDRHVAGLYRAVKACLIHNTLLGTPNIEITLHTAVIAHA
jgi:putative redox protein